MIEIIGYIIYTIVFQTLVFLKLLVYYYQLFSFKIRNSLSQLFMFIYIKSPNDYIEYIVSTTNTTTTTTTTTTKTITNNNKTTCTDKQKQTQLQQQQQQQQTLYSTTPKHLALILNHRDQIKSLVNNQETLNFYNKVSDILIWSLLVGVKRLTVFDNHGSLKKNISTFQNILDNKLKPFNSNNDNNTIYNFKWLNNSNNATSPTHNNNNTTTTTNNNKTLTISIVTVDDGKQELVNITKKYIKDSKLDSNLILNESYINSNLPNYIGGIDFEPEVALDFSDKYIFSGFLPWHIKLTEFIKMDHFNQFYLERFHHFLKIYSTIQKRCGK